VKSAQAIRFVAKPLVFGLALVPAAMLAAGAVRGTLGANPLEAITHGTGDWTLRFLLLTLAVTPFRWLTGWNASIRFRRMLGLFAFFYASLHLLTYLWFDKFFEWQEILKDIPKRPFITVGFTAFALLVPLALTSTTGMIRRLGGKRWQALHRLVYVAATAGVIHYWWLVKADTRTPRQFALALGALLAVRAWIGWGRRRRPVPGPAQGPAGRSAAVGVRGTAAW
jgi:sulfoxide reductase heme-binding subunit YedZ